MRWLNLPGKVTLIKSILSSLPIFDNMVLLTPKSIMNSITVELRKFLWQGGKNRGKKFHLVNWNVVKQPKLNGGLGIREARLMNTTMGAKLVRRMIAGKKEWWKEVLRKKYIRRPRIKSIEHDWTRKGTNI